MDYLRRIKNGEVIAGYYDDFLNNGILQILAAEARMNIVFLEDK